MKKWMLAALVLGALALPLEEALARGGRGGRGRSISNGPRNARRSSKKGRSKMIERSQDQNRGALLSDAARDRL